MEAGRSITAGPIRFGAFEADFASWQLRKNGQKLRLAGQPLDVLAILLEHPGSVVTRDEFRARLWPSTVVDYEHSLNAAIKKLRDALEDSAESPLYIETIPRHGYRFIASVEEGAVPPAPPVADDKPAANEKPAELPPLPVVAPALAATVAPGRARTGLMRAAIALAGIALLGSAVLWLGARKPAPLQYLQLTDFPDSASSPALSPNGEMVAFLRGEGTFVIPGELYVKLLSGGEPVQLTHDGLPKMSPVFSPDGSRIAYTINDRWAWDTWEVPVLGGAPRRWLRNASGLTWIGERGLLFSQIDAGIHMNLVTKPDDRSEATNLYRPPDGNGMTHRSALSPDGKWVLLVEMDHTGNWLPCRLIPFDGGSAGRTVGPAPARCTHASWSPDGKWMYFSADAGGGFHLFRQRFPPGEAEQITFGATEEEGVAVAPDGKSLITAVGEEQSSVWLHDPAGERQVSTEGYAYVPFLSPDQRKIFYLVRSRSAAELVSGGLWVLDLASGKREALFPGTLITRYDLSPSGSEIAFAKDEGRGRSSVWLAALGPEPSPVKLVSRDATRPLFVAGGSIVFVRKEAGRNFVYQSKRGAAAPEKLLPDPVISLQSASPDGRFVIAWVAAKAGERSGAVKAYPTDGGEPKLICAACSVSGTFPIVRWSRDQKFFYFASHAVPAMRGGKTVAIPLAAGQFFPDLPAAGINSDSDLLALPGVHVLPQTDVAPGPDPSSYAYSRMTTHRNLYRISIP